MRFETKQLSVPFVPFVIMEDVGFSDGKVWTVFHDRETLRFWLVQLDADDEVVGFISLPIGDLPILAAKAAEWADIYADYEDSVPDR